MSHISPTEDERICAWFECQTEETLRDLHERFDAVSPRECWTAFFNDCSSPAPESPGASLAVSVEAVQEVPSPSEELAVLRVVCVIEIQVHSLDWLKGDDRLYTIKALELAAQRIRDDIEACA
jgi:hypothetical protein